MKCPEKYIKAKYTSRDMLLCMIKTKVLLPQA
jgi:hypothetical protein